MRNTLANAGDSAPDSWVRKIPLEEKMASHSSILAWQISMDRGVWQATAHGVAKSWSRLRD